MHEANSLNNSLRFQRVWVNITVCIHRSETVNVSWSPERGQAHARPLCKRHLIPFACRKESLFPPWRNCVQRILRESKILAQCPSDWSSAAFHQGKLPPGDNHDVCQLAAETAPNTCLSEMRSKDALSSFSPAIAHFCGPCSLPKSVQKMSATWGWEDLHQWSLWISLTLWPKHLSA